VRRVGPQAPPAPSAKLYGAAPADSVTPPPARDPEGPASRFVLAAGEAMMRGRGTKLAIAFRGARAGHPGSCSRRTSTNIAAVRPRCEVSCPAPRDRLAAHLSWTDTSPRCQPPLRPAAVQPRRDGHRRGQRPEPRLGLGLFSCDERLTWLTRSDIVIFSLAVMILGVAASGGVPYRASEPSGARIVFRGSGRAAVWKSRLSRTEETLQPIPISVVWSAAGKADRCV
jgi:hypothetical protein